jgi:hypothetical protein
MTTPTSCPFCDKKGLPILPLRHAVARADTAVTMPKLQAPFGQGVSDIPLPGDEAHYTLRLLRSGYLYVFDERRGEWTAYVVTRQGYLFGFDPHAKTPPKVHDREFSCARAGDAHIARCVTVKDAKHATRVWLGFSDAPWTPAVLEKHAKQAYRQAHMQLFDVAAWRAGGTQPNVDTADKAAALVAEFTLSYAMAFGEASSMSRRFGSQYGRNAALAAEGAEAVMQQLSPWAHALGDLLDAALMKEKTADFVHWADTAAEPFRPAMVAMPDAAGMAIELNQLALQRALEWTEQPERKWKFETACAIGALRTAVENIPIKNEENRLAEAHAMTPFGGSDAQQTLAAQRAQALASASAERRPQIEAFYDDAQWMAANDVPGSYQRNLVTFARQTSALDLDSARPYIGEHYCEQTMHDARAWAKAAPDIKQRDHEALGEKAWAKYRDMLKGGDQKTADWETYLKTTYKTQFNTFEHSVIKPLDAAYLTWLKSDAFKTHFTHNFDPQDFRSGQAYQVLAYACIQDATGRQAVVDHLMQCLADDPTEPGSVFLRALVFNQQQLAQQWNQAASSNGGTLQTPGWLDTGSAVYAGLKDILAKEHIHDLNGTFTGLSKSIYQLSAPVMNLLNKAVAGGSRLLVQAALPEQRLLGLMQAQIQAENPGAQLREVTGRMTRKQAAKSLARYLAELSGDNEMRWRASARAAVKGMTEGKQYAFHALFIVDEEQLKNLQSLSNNQRAANIQNAVQAAEFDTLMHSNAIRIASREVTASGIGLILAGFTLVNSYGELAKAEMGVRFNFGAAVLTGLGALGETSGAVMKRVAWGTSDSAVIRAMSFGRWESYSEFASGAGKLLGAIGGVIAGAVQVWQGFESVNDGDFAFGLGSIILGFATGTITVILAFTTWISLGLGLIIVLLLVSIGFIISLFKHDKLQHWLDSCYFGKHQLSGEKFANLDQQTTALAALAKES